MVRITEEDFSPVYMDVRKHGVAEDTWPKIVLWALDSPLVYETMQVMVTVLQRQKVPYGEWEYIASVKPNDHTVSTDEERHYGLDPYAETGVVSVDPKSSFQECIEGIYESIDSLIR